MRREPGTSRREFVQVMGAFGACALGRTPGSLLASRDARPPALRQVVPLAERVGSPRFRLLYDIYHMQIMEGDVLRTIRDHREAFAHFHTAGVPGRHELDDRQELDYRGIARAIAETGFTGFLAHEFLPTRPPYEGIREAVATCAA